MYRRQFTKLSERQQGRQIKRKQHTFRSGMISDLPVGTCPRDASGNPTGVQEADNFYLYNEEYAKMRSGTGRLSATKIPALTTGISATKTGSTITVSAGYTFTSADVGRYFVHDGGDNELIDTFTDGANVDVTVSTAQSASTAGQIRAESNSDIFHSVHSKWVAHVGTKVYYADAAITAWVEIYNVNSQALPSDKKSQMYQVDNDAFLWTDAGLFRIEVGATVPTMEKVNNEMLTNTISSVIATEERVWGRRYITTLGEMSGTDYNVNRIDGNVVVQESGATKLDSDLIDYSEVYQDRPFGPEGDVYGILTGATLAAARDIVSEWESITDGQVKFLANGETRNIETDFSGCVTFSDVSDKIQVALRDFWPQAVFEYDEDHFVFTMPDVGDTVGYITAGAAGTDISADDYLNMDVTNGIITIPDYYKENHGENVSFSRLSQSIPSSDLTLCDVIAFGDKLIVPSDDAATSGTLYSFDGITWARDTTFGQGLSTKGYGSGVLNDKMYVIGGEGASFEAEVFSSSTGMAWVQETLSGDDWGSRLYHVVLVFDSKLWIIGGLDADTSNATNDVYYSTDGIAWTQATAAAAFSVRRNHFGCVMNGKMWIMGGSNDANTYNNEVWSSSDGVTWAQTTTTDEFSARAFARAATFNGKMYVIGGYPQLATTYIALNDVYSSEDGTTWTKEDDLACGGRAEFAITEFNNSLVILGGSTENFVDVFDCWSANKSRLQLGYGQASSSYRGSFTASQSTTTITISSGAYFTDDDAFKTIAWADGTTSQIIWPTSTTVAHSYTSETRASQLGAIVEYKSNYYQEYTHHSIYATKDIGFNGINRVSGKGNDPNLFIWLEDVPIIKSFVITYVVTTGAITASSGVFKKYDVGSILVLSDGSEGLITSFTDSTHVTWTRTDLSGAAVAATIGTTFSFTATQATTTVTIAAPAGGRFVATDVGKRIFWSDGTISIITAYTSATVATVADSTTRTALGGGILNSPNISAYINYRNFNDSYTDEVVDGHSGGYLLGNRFWEPLPDSNVGAYVPGFLISGPRGGKSIYANQLKDPWLAGYYHPRFQKYSTEDAITDIRTYTDVWSAICHNSTTSWESLNVGTRTTEFGESIDVFLRKRLVDSEIGSKDPSGIIFMEDGIDIVKTSTNEIRTFDGNGYSKNYAAQKIMKQLRKLQAACAMSYDDVGGLYVWGTTGALTTAGSKTLLPYPDVCWRFAFTKEQGVLGGTKVSGDDWVAPPNGIGGLRIIDANGNALHVVLDNISGLRYWISTYDGPTGSGLSEVFLDKYDGSTGTEISGSLTLKSHMPSEHHMWMRSATHHFNFEPNDENNRDETGYDAYGFRDGLKIDVEIYKDSCATLFGKANDINIDDDDNPIQDPEVSFQEDDEAHSMNLKISVNRSEVKYLPSTHYYIAYDKPAPPSQKRSSETDYQLSLDNMEGWFTRGDSLLLNRVSGETVT